MTMYPPMYPPRASRAGRGMAAHRFCLTTDNRHAQKGTPSPVPYGKNLTQLFTMGRVQPRSLGNRGGVRISLASSFPLCPRNRCITEPFCPCLHRNRYVSGACLSPTCTGIGKTCHRVATGMVHCPCGTASAPAPAPVTGTVRHATH